jgi:hypothetical protein
MTCVLAMGAAADAAPRVLDIIPSQGPVAVIAAAHVEQADAAVRRLLGTIGHEGYAGLAAVLDTMGARAGLDLAGSAAVVVYPAARGSGPLRTVLMLPVSDADRFFAGVGAEPDGGVQRFRYAGVEYFARGAGQTHALVGDSRALVERFDAKEGRLPVHAAAAGAAGRQILEGAHVVALTSAPGVEAMVDSRTALAGPEARLNAAGDGAVSSTILGRLAHLARSESRTITIGLTILDAGARIDVASTFAADGVLARAAVATETVAASALELFPADTVVAAVSIDAAHPGLRILADELAMPGRIEGVMVEAERAAMTAIESAEALGMAVFEPPSLMFGGLSRAVVAWRAPRPEEPAAALRAWIESLHDRPIGSGRIVSAYTPSGATIAGRPADQWTISLPAASAGWLPFTFGSPPTVEGVTFLGGARGLASCSRDRELLDHCAAEIPIEESLARSPRLAASAGALPGRRLAEGFLDVGPVLKQFAPMLTRGGALAAAEERFTPIAAALTAREGSAGLAVVIPADVLRVAVAVWLGSAEDAEADASESAR